MNAQRLRKLCNFKYLFNAQKPRSSHATKNVYKSDSDIAPLPKEEARISELGNGIKVGSIENNAPLTEVSVVIKAGTRYEDPKTNLGVVHCLRNAAILSSKNHSKFSLCRNTEIRGGQIYSAVSKDHLFYTLTCSRDEVDPCLEILSEIVTQQVFKPWELSDIQHQMKVDADFHHMNPGHVLEELLHKAAYRGGYANSLVCPEWMLGKHDPEMLHHYVQEHFTNARAAVAGLGISHDHLQSRVNDLFNFNNKSTSANTGASKFAPGGEVRLEADIDQVHVAIVAEGAGCKNEKDAASLSLLHLILGGATDRSHMSDFSRLGIAAAKSTKDPFYVNSLISTYTDSGLFGLHIVGSPDSMNDLVKAVVAEMKQAAKSVSEKDLQEAKHRYKAQYLMHKESSENVLYDLAVEVNELGQARQPKHTLDLIDSIMLSDVQSVAARVTKAKPAMAAYGRLHNTPHVDELLQ